VNFSQDPTGKKKQPEELVFDKTKHKKHLGKVYFAEDSFKNGQLTPMAVYADVYDLFGCFISCHCLYSYPTAHSFVFN
jgi:hypothetical protein